MGNGTPGGRYAAYMYRVTKDPKYAQIVMNGVMGVIGRTIYTDMVKIEGPAAVKPLSEGPQIPALATNGVNQNTLNLMEEYAMIADQLPKEVPPNLNGGGGRGRGGARGGARGARGNLAPTETPAQPAANE